MNLLRSAIIFVLLSTIVITGFGAEVIYVSSQAEFDNAHDSSSINDSIIWRSGTYTDIFMDIDNDNLFISAEELGETIFTGASRVDITGDYITLQGFQFLNGNIGTRDVINTRGSYNLFTQINISGYTCYKYLRVREESQYVSITYCNFEKRLNLDDQNILSILVDENNPGYHKIQYCSFKNFDGTGNDLGIEPIRIGLSTQADHISRTLVEYCYFTQCNGDGEIISSKASQNVYRYNTFENNPLAELVLRHGSEAIVYGNFFLKGKGGVRVREGQNHYIYNNYFYELDDRTIYLQNESSDPLDNINIAFNTVVSCSEIILGGNGSNKPTNVTFANNIFTDPDDDLFEDPTSTETWISNIYFGDLGIALPGSGLMSINPDLQKNIEGFYGLTQNSLAVNSAQQGYASLPQFEGIEDIDATVTLDMMGQNRPASVEERDLGSNEYPHNILIQPMATEDNTGPGYLNPVTTSINNNIHSVNDLIKIHPNPVLNQLYIEINSPRNANIKLEIFNSEGRNIKTAPEKSINSGKTNMSIEVEDIPSGFYSIRATSVDLNNTIKSTQILTFIKS